jgi:transglutaminase superfamily protein
MSSQLETAVAPAVRRSLAASPVLAFFGLAAADVLMKFGGFHRLYDTVRRWPVSRKKSANTEQIGAVIAAIDRAGRYYPKHALCLQRSAVGTCLLRMAGVPAQMVMGCRKIPFRGHAWVEVNGEVVNDKPNVQVHYRVLDRC